MRRTTGPSHGPREQIVIALTAPPNRPMVYAMSRTITFREGAMPTMENVLAMLTKKRWPGKLYAAERSSGAKLDIRSERTIDLRNVGPNRGCRLLWRGPSPEVPALGPGRKYFQKVGNELFGRRGGLPCTSEEAHTECDFLTHGLIKSAKVRPIKSSRKPKKSICRSFDDRINWCPRRRTDDVSTETKELKRRRE
jgi:hypothetical protein